MEDKYSKQKKRITSVLSLFFVLQRYYFGFLQVAMSLIKYFCNNSNKESNEAPASSSADEPIAISIQMPTNNYKSQESFSTLEEIKSKKRNSIHDIDAFMPGAIEKETKPRYL